MMIDDDDGNDDGSFLHAMPCHACCALVVPALQAIEKQGKRSCSLRTTIP
jgi:hypothetical protein